MEVLFLGTAAAEGWPAPFCSCKACTSARHLGGKDIRLRSGAVIDDVVKIDIGPDTVAQMQRVGRDLTRVRTLLITHAHHDHFSPSELGYRKRGFVTRDTVLPLLSVYGNEEVMGRLTDEVPPATVEAEYLPPIRPFVPFATPDGSEVVPLEAAHSPGALLFLIERGGKRLLWGHDTACLPQSTVAALAGVPLDGAVFDCTHGGAPGDFKNHMSIKDVIEAVEILRKQGTITAETRVVANHFSHNGLLMHAELETRFAPAGIGVAYDGMVLTL